MSVRLLLIGWLASISVGLQAAEVPRYKPSSRAEAVDVSSAAYGASQLAPRALTIGDLAPEFTVPTVAGELVSLSALVAEGPVAIIFYRGHW